MWVRFNQRYDFSPDAMKGRVTIVYKAGVHNVTRECADKAIAAGKAVRTTSPRTKEPDDAEE
jgi:hypothetical protein